MPTASDATTTPIKRLKTGCHQYAQSICSTLMMQYLAILYLCATKTMNHLNNEYNRTRL